MSAVCNGRMSTYTASTRYGIPKTTLRRRIKSGKIDKTLGRHATFSQDQERDLVDRLIGLSELGKPLTSQTLSCFYHSSKFFLCFFFSFNVSTYSKYNNHAFVVTTEITLHFVKSCRTNYFYRSK